MQSWGDVVGQVVQRPHVFRKVPVPRAILSPAAANCAGVGGDLGPGARWRADGTRPVEDTFWSAMFA
jgi:hypothetical protein